MGGLTAGGASPAGAEATSPGRSVDGVAATGMHEADVRRALSSLGADTQAARVVRHVAEARLRRSYRAQPAGTEVVAVDVPTAGLSTKAAAFELRQGAASAERVVAQVAAPLISAAGTWRDLHAALAAEGIAYVAKGSGAVIVVGDQPVKASTVDRKAALTQLVKRLGPYEGGTQPVVPRAREPAPGVSRVAFEAFEDARRFNQDAIDEARARRASINFEAKPRTDRDVREVLSRLQASARRAIQVPSAIRDFRAFKAQGNGIPAAERPAKGQALPGTPARGEPAPHEPFFGSSAPGVPTPEGWTASKELAAAIYHAHREDVLRQARRDAKGDRVTINASIVDSRIAQRLRANGHRREAVERTLASVAREEDLGKRRDWGQYASRLTARAFSPASTEFFRSHPHHAEHWAAVERKAETAAYRAARKVVLQRLKDDLDALWKRRIMTEEQMWQRHRMRCEDLRRINTRLKRLRRAGTMVAILSLLVELSVIRPLLKQSEKAHAAEHEALRDAVRRDGAALRQARAAWRKGGEWQLPDAGAVQVWSKEMVRPSFSRSRQRRGGVEIG